MKQKRKLEILNKSSLCGLQDKEKDDFLISCNDDEISSSLCGNITCITCNCFRN